MGHRSNDPVNRRLSREENATNTRSKTVRAEDRAVTETTVPSRSRSPPLSRASRPLPSTRSAVSLAPATSEIFFFRSSPRLPHVRGFSLAPLCPPIAFSPTDFLAPSSLSPLITLITTPVLVVLALLPALPLPRAGHPRSLHPSSSQPRFGRAVGPPLSRDFRPCLRYAVHPRPCRTRV